MKRILVPCDFTDTAIEAFKFAISITLKEKGELFVLNVLDMTSMGGSSALSHAYTFNAQFIRDHERIINERFQAMWQKYSPMTLGVKFNHQVGSFVQEVEKFITLHNIDLVVMGTSGTSEKKWGSNVEKIVRHSTVPVIAIRANPVRPISKIVVPIGMFEKPDLRFTDELTKLQRFYDAQLELLYINTPLFFMTDRAMQKNLHDFAQNLALTNYHTFFRSDTTIQDGIAHFVKETDADMLAMGTHGWKGLGHLLFGSFTEDVVNTIQIPMWTCVLD